MFSIIKNMPSPQSIFSADGSMATSLMLFRSMANQLIPSQVRGYLAAGIRYLLKSRSSVLTFVIEESTGMFSNQVFDAAEIYLCTKISTKTERLKISKTPKQKKVSVRLERGEKIVDDFEGIDLQWSFNCIVDKNNTSNSCTQMKSEKRYLELSFHRKHKDKVLGFYIPFVLEEALAIKSQERVLKLHTMNMSGYYNGKWDSVTLEHPAKFETLAMEPDLKNLLIEDLNRFVKRKEFYKRVGKAWKRGYLLYGPPGTGKSSLVAAMANYLKFDIYDLQLGNVMRDSDLRKLLLTTANQSILVIEDIDCSAKLPNRQPKVSLKPKKRQSPPEPQVTLSGLLNFIDGLWSSCGDERIIIFTTNHKDRLDPALLRPGRMDMHIHMSYCTFNGFKLLAANYLQIANDDKSHYLYPEIENLFGETQVTPAQVAEELMKSENVDVSLHGLLKLLKRKKTDLETSATNGDAADGEIKEKEEEIEEEDEDEDEDVGFRDKKRLKIQHYEN